MGRLDRERTVDNDGDIGDKNWLRAGLKVFALLKFRVPLWVIAIFVVVLGGWNISQSISRESPTNLKPTITDAQRVEVRITMCNERVDELGLNVRNEEVRLQERFIKVENVQRAGVRIERRDCEEKK